MQHPDNAFGIGFILLTSKGLCIGTRPTAMLLLKISAERRNTIDIGKLLIDLLLGNRGRCLDIHEKESSFLIKISLPERCHIIGVYTKPVICFVGDLVLRQILPNGLGQIFRA